MAGTDVGGLDREELEQALTEVAAGYADTQVVIRTADGEVTTTAGVVGLELDPMVTADNVMEIGRGSTVGRPFSWFGGLFGSRSATTAVRLGAGDPATLEAVVNAGQPEPVEPGLGYEDGRVVVVPGRPVQTFDLSNIRDDVVAAARAGESPILVEAGSLELNPSMTDDEAQVWADEFNALTEGGFTTSAVGDDEAFDAATVRSWMRFTDTGEEFTYALDQDAVRTSLTERYGEPEQPDESVIEVIDGRPRLVGFIPTRCCTLDSHERIQRAITEGRTSAALVLEPVDESEEDILRRYGIFDLVGQATTPYDCCQSRVTNIQLFADLMTGVVLEPGESISLNDHVGRRTTEKGFVPAGVISRGELSSDVGGGISQFATTIFQAMFYGGIDIDRYQAHTLWFNRYLDFAGRRGIESTISFPEPDVQFTNNTPYRVMIWPSYTDTSLTVSVYSIQWTETDVLEQREYFSGQCTVIETDRIREYEDGTEEVDTFRAFYQPRDGIGCDGEPTNPTPTPVPTPTPEGGGEDDGGEDGGGEDEGDGGDDG
ncbi:MAG: VanW family protein, partial [Actinomycetota bacterium]